MIVFSPQICECLAIQTGILDWEIFSTQVKSFNDYKDRGCYCGLKYFAVRSMMQKSFLWSYSQWHIGRCKESMKNSHVGWQSQRVKCKWFSYIYSKMKFSTFLVWYLARAQVKYFLFQVYLYCSWDSSQNCICYFIIIFIAITKLFVFLTLSSWDWYYPKWEIFVSFLKTLY